MNQLIQQSLDISNALLKELKMFKASLFRLKPWRFHVQIDEQEPLVQRQVAINSFGQVFYEDDQEPTESLALPGAIAVTADILEQAKQLNEAKTLFKTHFVGLSKQHVTYEGEQITLARRVLKGTEFERLHNLQASRLIHFVDETPESIRLTLAQAANPTRVSKKKVRTLLAEHFGSQEDQLRRSLDKLNQIPTNETLVWARKVKPRPRLNIKLKNGEYLMCNGVIPFLYLLEEEDKGALPMISLQAELKSPRARSRARLEEPALICSPQLTIFRYQREYRTE